jgi:hypothetical protein
MVRLLQNTIMVSVVHFAKVWAKDYLLLSCPYLSLPSEGIIPACLGLGWLLAHLSGIPGKTYLSQT